MQEETFKRKPLTENLYDFIDKLSINKKDYNLTWQEIADICREYGCDHSESWYRRRYKNLNTSEESEIEESKEITSLEDKILELKKEKVKISDERIQNNAYIRQMAREETIKEIALKTAQCMNSKKMLSPFTLPPIGGDFKTKCAILEISDWHYGIDINNYWNIYNPEIARKRVSYLRDKVREYCLANRITDLYIVNLADLIAGRIHLGLRLESRFDVITQTMEVAEILAEFINDLASNFKIHYYDCLDNHSRLEPNKADAMDLESLARLIPWYLKERLGKSKEFGIEINGNEYDEGIITFKCNGFDIVGIHGDKDVKSKLNNLILMLGKKCDLICIAHLHHFWADENNNIKIIGNGSLMGTDTYAKNLRLNSSPSQNLIIVGDNNVCEAVYNIKVEESK